MKIKDVFELKIVNSIDRFEIELLLSFVLNKPRAYLMAYPDEELSQQNLKVLLEICTRRKNGEPIAYILGKKEFWSKEFIVNDYTLIPRPETELLIESVLEQFPTSGQFDFLKLGTGCGIISVTLTTLYSNIKMLATDISDETLKIAQLNKKHFNAHHLTLQKSDWFSEIDAEKKFDLIVSNPPYISQSDAHLSNGDLRFEPKAALIAGQKGTECLENIIVNASAHLKKGGVLMLEHGYDQASCVETLFKQNGFFEVKLKKDLNGIPRVTMGKIML